MNNKKIIKPIYQFKIQTITFENVWIIWSETFYLKIVTDQVWNHFEFELLEIWNSNTEDALWWHDAINGNSQQDNAIWGIFILGMLQPSMNIK